MKTIITGSWTCHRYADLLAAVDVAALVGIVPTKVISGAQVGVDQLALRYAHDSKLPVGRFVRDQEPGIVTCADAMIAVQHNADRRTARMIAAAREHGLQVCVWEV